MVVYLVGAGPGDPELVTLKAVNVLKKADVVIYDRLANEEILKNASGAEMIYVGKKAGAHHKTQEEINQILIDKGKNHKLVVRLKGGDPFVFGRGGEEIMALLEEEIPVEVIPGVTSAIGVPGTVGLPVTHRGVATSVTVVTGHEDPTKAESQVKWDFNADTIIILMGIGKLEENTREIMKYKHPETPVCVIEKGTLPGERIVTGTLETITQKNIKPPALVIIGPVVDIYKKIAQKRDKIMKRLEGKVIAVTRPLERAQEAVDIITREGGVALLAPTLELTMIRTDSLMELCRHASELDWLIFTSPASLDSLFRYCDDFKDRLNPECFMAVIGPRTERALQEKGLEADLVPEDYTAEGLLEVMAPYELEGKTIGIPRTFSARGVLPEGLRKMGAQIILAEAYQSTIPHDPQPVQKLIKSILNVDIDAVTFTSPLTVHNLFEMAADKKKDLISALQTDKIKVVAIGPITGNALEEYDIKYVAPDKYTVEEMLNKMAEELS
ncbi:MAG: uroporphyrinogen-III C-methyltransferase [Methanobacteriales archaeon Met13]